jgi:repressor LexA
MDATPQAQLTPRQRDVLLWIAEHIERHGYSPTIREGQAAFGFKSPHEFWLHVAALERKGFVRCDRKRARSLRLTTKATVADSDAPRPA